MSSPPREIGEAVADPPARAAPSPAPGQRLRKALSFRNISAIYVFVIIFVIFSLWIPETFLRVDTWKTLLDSQAVTGMLAVGLVIALSAGAFDLAIGAELGFGAIVVAWLLADQRVPLAPAIVLTVLAGLLVGLINGLLIVKVRIDSFIATLGVSSILLALIAWISSSQQIVGLSSEFQSIGTTEVLGLTVPVYLMLAVGLLVWYVLAWTPLGRQVYATGGNIEAARLAGVRTSAIIVGALMSCAAIAGLAGTLVSSSLGAGDPTIGPAYLLPAFTAAFLGSTQFSAGRFNVLGTVVAVYVLAAGVKGLQLAGAPTWIPELFNGAALLLAVGLAKYKRDGQGSGAIRRLFGFRDQTAPPSQEGAAPTI